MGIKGGEEGVGRAGEGVEGRRGVGRGRGIVRGGRG